MSCYNCGYDVSVVCKDDYGWLCEWCSDMENKGQLKHKKEIIKMINIMGVLTKEISRRKNALFLKTEYHDYDVVKLLESILNNEF